MAKLRELIEDIAVAMVVTVTPDGALRSRPMWTQEMREEGELWFFASDDSEIAHDLSEEHAVNVSYAEPERDRYVSVTGLATLVKDRKKIEEFWDDSLTRYFRKGLSDPHLTLMCVRIESAEYWDAEMSKMLPLRQRKNQRHADAAKKSNDSSDARREGDEGTDGHTKIDIRAVPTSG